MGFGFLERKNFVYLVNPVKKFLLRRNFDTLFSTVSDCHAINEPLVRDFLIIAIAKRF